MAQVSNYGELKTWVANTGHRGDLAADIPGFIENAESMIASSVRAVEMVRGYQIAETDRALGAIYNLPSDFLGARMITGTHGGDDYQLKQVSLAELYRYSTSGSNARFYVTYARKVEFRPSPATDATFELIYYQRFDALSADGDTNLLLTAHPLLYQHAAMHWFHIHTQDVELAAAHEASFDTAADDVNALAQEVRGSAGVAPGYNFHSGSAM